MATGFGAKAFGVWERAGQDYTQPAIKVIVMWCGITGLLTTIFSRGAPLPCAVRPAVLISAAGYARCLMGSNSRKCHHRRQIF